jgi:hypothetical protein
MTTRKRREARTAKGLPARTAAEIRSRAEYRKREHEKKRSALRDWLNSIKVERGCTDCGYKDHPEALHFDHLPGMGKAGNVSALVNNLSAQKLKDEISKCEVVCANCHAIRTASRRP